MQLRNSCLFDRRQRALERALVLRREADDDVGREVEVDADGFDATQERRGRVPTSHVAQNIVIPRLERDVQVPGHSRSLPQRGGQPLVEVVDLDRREPEPAETRGRSGLAHEARQVVAGRPVAIAPEVDARQDNLGVALVDASANLPQDGGSGAATRRAANERDHAEVAREAAAVLHLDEGAHALEPRIAVNAPDRADIARHELRRLLTRPGNHPHVGRHPGESIAGEIGAAARHVHARMRSRGP